MHYLGPPEFLLILGVAGAIAAVYLFLALLMFPFVYIRNLRCRLLFRKWLKENRFQVVSHVERWYWHGPFSGDRNDTASVSRLEVRDSEGSVRRAFVRCPNHKTWLFGRHELQVHWDDQPVDLGHPSAARLWIWLGLPFVMGAIVLGIYAMWPAHHLSLVPPSVHLLIAAPFAVGIGLLIREKYRGFPNLRKLVLMDQDEFFKLLCIHLGTCAGGFLVSAGALFLCFLDLHHPAWESQIVNEALLAPFFGLAIFGVGWWQLAVRIRRLSPRAT